MNDTVPEERKRSTAGRRTRRKIVECAHAILRSESYEQLTMQGIAKRLGIRLSNVQYYFSSKSELINALLQYNNEQYFQQWQRIDAVTEGQPEERFRTYLKFNLADIRLESTRHFFIQLWPLLSTADNYSGRLLKALYEPQMRKLVDLIMDINPQLKKGEARMRAELIASMIEGFMVTTPAVAGSARKNRQRDELAIAAAFSIATAPC